MYSFGYLFKYGDDDCCSTNYDLLVKPKYKSLKHELLRNEIYTLTNEQFNLEYKKAEIHFTSMYCKNNHQLQGINIQQIFALMVYCNFDALQHEFSKTYRENEGNQHKMFYHLGKCLKMAVHQHGIRIKNSNVQRFWHGISEKMLFPRYVNDIYICGPLSTTSHFPVAFNFTNNGTGCVIEFSDISGFIKCFPMAWLSDYPNEHEHLFIQNEFPLKIENIIDTATGFEYGTILHALNIIDDLMSGRHAVITKEIQRLICEIVSHQLSLFSSTFISFESLTNYAKNMIQKYFEEKHEIHVNIEQMQQQHPSLKHLLFTHQVNIVKLLSILFPSLKVLHFEKFHGSFISIISSARDYYQKHKISKLECIQIHLSNPLSDLRKRKILSVWESEFGAMNVKITTKDRRIVIGRNQHCPTKKICMNYPIPKYSKLSQYFSKNAVISKLILRTYIWNTKLMDIIECFLDNQITDSYFNDNHKQQFRETLEKHCPNILTEFIWNYMAKDTVAGSAVVKQLEEFEKLESFEINELSNELHNVLMEGNEENEQEDATIEGEPEQIHIELERETSTNSFKQYSNRLISCSGDCGSKLSTLIANCTKKEISFEEYSNTIGDAFWLNDSPLRVLLTNFMDNKAISRQRNYQQIYKELIDENCFIGGDEWARKMGLLFIKLYKDNHFDILQAIANASCEIKHQTLMEEINAFNKDNNETVLGNRKQYKSRINAIKQKKEYMIMKQHNLELSNWELASVMLYCNGGLIANEIRKSHQDDHTNSCQWKHLTTHLLSALHKIYIALHFQNKEFKNEYIDGTAARDNKLFHGLSGVSLTNDNMEHLFMYTVTSFTEDFYVANGYASSDGIMLVIDNAYQLIYNGQLKAANVSWISQWGKGETEWIVLPTEFRSIMEIHGDNKIYKRYMRLRNPKIYEIGIETLKMPSYEHRKIKHTKQDALLHSNSVINIGSSHKIVQDEQISENINKSELYDLSKSQYTPTIDESVTNICDDVGATLIGPSIGVNKVLDVIDSDTKYDECQDYVKMDAHTVGQLNIYWKYYLHSYDTKCTPIDKMRQNSIDSKHQLSIISTTNTTTEDVHSDYISKSAFVNR